LIDIRKRVREFVTKLEGGILPDWGGMLPDRRTGKNNTDHHQRMLYKREDGYDAAQKIQVYVFM